MRGRERLSFVGFSFGAALLAVVFAGMTVLDRASAIPLLWSVLVRCMVILLLCFVVEFTDSRARLFGGRPAWRTLLWCLLPPLFALLASYGVVNTHPGLVKGTMIALNVLSTVIVEELYYRFFGLYLFRQKKENPILPILFISLVWGLSYLGNLVGERVDIVLMDMVMTAACGVFLCALYLRTNQILVPFFAHLGFEGIEAFFGSCSTSPQGVAGGGVYFRLLLTVVYTATGFWMLFSDRRSAVCETASSTLDSPSRDATASPAACSLDTPTDKQEN